MEKTPLQEKRYALHLYAEKIGLCNQCMRSETETGTKRCQKCKIKQKEYMQKIRKEPSRCSRCGGPNSETGKYKTCARCRASLTDKRKKL